MFCFEIFKPKTTVFVEICQNFFHRLFAVVVLVELVFFAQIVEVVTVFCRLK